MKSVPLAQRVIVVPKVAADLVVPVALAESEALVALAAPKASMVLRVAPEVHGPAMLLSKEADPTDR